MTFGWRFRYDLGFCLRAKHACTLLILKVEIHVNTPRWEEEDPVVSLHLFCLAINRQLHQFHSLESSKFCRSGEPFWLTPSRVKGTVLFLSIPWKAGKRSRMHSHVSIHLEMSGPHRAFAENRRLEMALDSCLESGTGCNHGFEYSDLVENV